MKLIQKTFDQSEDKRRVLYCGVRAVSHSIFYLRVMVENNFELEGASRVVEKGRRKGLALFSKRLCRD